MYNIYQYVKQMGHLLSLCGSRKYPYTPWKVTGNYSHGEGSLTSHGKESIKLDWNFQKDGGIQTKKLSVEEEWIFSGTTHCQ